MLKQISKEIVCCIYKITSPSSKIYIGQSINVYKRIANYRCGHCKNQTYLYHSIQKYGWDAHIFEIIQECSPDQLNELEKYYVDLFQTFNSQNGLNVKDGGGKSGSHSEETKRKIGLGNLGKKLSEEAKKRIGYLSSLKKLSPEHISKLCAFGKKHTDEWKIKASERNSGEKSYFFGRRKFGAENHRYGKKQPKESYDLIRKIILNTETGIFYSGTVEAAFSIGMKWNLLRDRINGTTKNNTSLIRV